MTCFISLFEWLLVLSLPRGLALTSQCPLQWQAADQNLPECPFGRAFISVTIPEKGKARWLWNKTHPNGEWIPPYIVAADDDDFHRGSFWTAIFVFYGYVPYGVAVLAVLPMLCGTVGTRELSFLVFAVLVFFISELVLKNMFCEARPVMSCVTTCGMPSGHSALAMGYWTCMVLDVILRLHAKDPAHGEHRVDRLCDTCCNCCTSMFVCSKYGCSPLIKQPDVNHVEGVAVVLIWSIILLPVPVSRIGNHDHSPAQVMAGSLVGTICGVLWTGYMRHLQHKCFQWSGKTWGTRIEITHNFVLPAYVAHEKYLCLKVMKDASEALTEDITRIGLLYSKDFKNLKNVEMAWCEKAENLRQDKKEIDNLLAKIQELSEDNERLKANQDALEDDNRRLAKTIEDRLQAKEVQQAVVIHASPFSGKFEDTSGNIRVLIRTGDDGYCQTSEGTKLFDFHVSGDTATILVGKISGITGKCVGQNIIQWTNGTVYHRWSAASSV